MGTRRKSWLDESGGDNGNPAADQTNDEEGGYCRESGEEETEEREKGSKTEESEKIRKTFGEYIESKKIIKERPIMIRGKQLLELLHDSRQSVAKLNEIRDDPESSLGDMIEKCAKTRDRRHDGRRYQVHERRDALQRTENEKKDVTNILHRNQKAPGPKTEGPLH